MGSIGNTEVQRSVMQIYRENNVAQGNAIRQAFRNGDITAEQRDEQLAKVNAGVEQIINRMIDNFTDATEKSLVATMDRQFALTGGSDITGNLQFFKTANGFVLTASATRSNFRAFMDENGEVRRLPNGEMNTAREIRVPGRILYDIDKRFSEISRRRNG